MSEKVMRYVATTANITLSLKVVSATFSLFCFVSLKETTFETRKNIFYFTSKALFPLK